MRFNNCHSENFSTILTFEYDHQHAFMKGSITIIFALLFVIMGCKKETASPYYFNFELGNKNYSFDSIYGYKYIGTSGEGPVYSINIQGNNSKTQEHAYVGLTRFLVDSLTGIYYHPLVDPSAVRVLDVFQISFPSQSNSTIDRFTSIGSNEFLLTISEITDDFIKGSFSGNITRETPYQVVLITNGQFKIHRSY